MVGELYLNEVVKYTCMFVFTVLKMVSDALCHLIVSSTTNSLIYLIFSCFCSSSGATEVFLFFPGYIRHVTASGPLHLLFLISRMPFSDILICSLLHFLQIFAPMSTCE